MEEEKKAASLPKGQSFKLNSCGFIRYELYPIVSLAYSPSLKLIAVARETINSIEIYKYPSFCLAQTLNLNASDIISKILFHQEESILVICQNGMFYEFRLDSILPFQKVLIPGGALNDISLCKESGEYLLASDDGSIKIYDYKEDTSRIAFARAARNFNTRAIACVWDDTEKTCFYGSYQNGMVRKFDRLLNVSLLINLAPSAKSPIFAWRMLCLSSTLILGTSTGAINFYETKFGTLIKAIKFHESDILSLCCNPNGTAFYATGSDSRIISIENLKKEEGDNWVMTSQERGQSHDIYSMVMIDDGLLISGGLTTDLCLYKLEGGRFAERLFAKNEKQDEKAMELERKVEVKLRHITGLQNNSLIYCSDPPNGFVLFHKNFGLELWKLDVDKREFCFALEVKNKEKTIVSACLSPCGGYLAYSTLDNIIIHQIVDLKLEKLHEISDFPATSLRFSPDSNFLYFISPKPEFFSYDIRESSVVSLGLLKPSAIFSNIEVSSEFVAIGSKLKNRLLVYKERELYYEIPEIMPEGYVAFRFGGQDDKLFVAYENNKLAGFDLRNKCLDKWSSQNINKFPFNYLNKLNRIIGICLHPDNKNKLILYTNYYYILINLSQKVPKKSRIVHWEEKKKAKTPLNFDIISRKFPILSIQNYNENEFLLCQNSWNQLLKSMPGAINTKKFGN